MYDRMKMLKPFVMGMVTMLALACGDQHFFEKNVAIPNRSWNYSEMPKFEVAITDNKATYDIWINVRNTGEYNYANLFLLVHENGPKLRDTAFRYELKLAEVDGRWTGKSAGSLYENQLLLKENFSFPDTGKYTFAVEQNMRENPLRDITDIGIKIKKR